jgi:hypothetical protein
MAKFLTRDGIAARGHTHSNKHLLYLERHGRFPRRVYLGNGRTPVWVEEEVEAHEAACIARRDAPRPPSPARDRPKDSRGKFIPAARAE